MLPARILAIIPDTGRHTPLLCFHCIAGSPFIALQQFDYELYLTLEHGAKRAESVRSSTMANQNNIDPVDMQMYIDRAHEMRAEAIRSSFTEFSRVAKKLFSRLANIWSIPRTEQI